MLEAIYRAFFLDKYEGKISLVNRAFRKLQLKEILVKLEYPTVHPYDLMFIACEYGGIEPTKFPIVPGFESSGEIIAIFFHLIKFKF
jgi:D-arabinose 1-dehydrogenase-like Zn-dependent alcohol dehydrogenase